jgi:hypothetical protein
LQMESNRERYDRTPHAEQYHLPVKTRSVHAPVRWPSSRLYTTSFTIRA